MADESVVDLSNNILVLTVTDGCSKETPYQFSAKLDPSSTTEGAKTVNLVMPLGGVVSGLYRSPKAGEKVLVAYLGGTSYYLMGYLPDNKTQVFSPAKQKDKDGNVTNVEDASEVIECKAEVFRYNKEGANTSSCSPYSELGFYQKDTLWKETDDAQAPPKVDRINIQSTGDIYTDADNHHRLTARRLEMLATASKSGFNYKDVNAESKSMKSGDIRILAEGDITIEAGNSISLRVGRTSVKISDFGFSVKSQLIESPVSNPFDSALDISNKDGISMFGKVVDIKSGYKWSIATGLGAIISGTVGNVVLGGRQIEMSTQSMAEQMTNDILYGADMGFSIAMASSALDANAHETHAESAQTTQFALLATDNIIKFLANSAFYVYKSYVSYTKKFPATNREGTTDLSNVQYEPLSTEEDGNTTTPPPPTKDYTPYTWLCMLFDFIMEMIKLVRLIVEERVGTSSTVQRLWHNVSNTAGDFIDVEGSKRDNINLGFLVAESLAVEAFAAIGTIMANASAGKNSLAIASVSLLQNGITKLSGDELFDNYATRATSSATAPTEWDKWTKVFVAVTSGNMQISKAIKAGFDAYDTIKAVTRKDPEPPLLGSDPPTAAPPSGGS